MTPLTAERMTCDPELRLRLDRLQTRALAAGCAGLLLSVGAWVAWPEDFFPAYLVGYLFWLGIVLGSLGLTMLHHLVGGSWGLVIRRPLEAGAATVPLLAVLFLPIALGIPHLYPWAHPETADRVSEHLRAHYLNAPLFLERAGGYFGVWTAWGSCLSAGRAGKTVQTTIGRADGFSD